MSNSFANEGNYVMAKYGWPHMGNADGHGCKICYVQKITPTGKARVVELPTEKVNVQHLDGNVTSWDKIVTSKYPIEGTPSKLVRADGSCKHDGIHLTYEVIPESRLDEPFPEKYDSYN